MACKIANATILLLNFQMVTKPLSEERVRTYLEEKDEDYRSLERYCMISNLDS